MMALRKSSSSAYMLLRILDAVSGPTPLAASTSTALEPYSLTRLAFLDSLWRSFLSCAESSSSLLILMTSLS